MDDEEIRDDEAFDDEDIKAPKKGLPADEIDEIDEEVADVDEFSDDEDEEDM